MPEGRALLLSLEAKYVFPPVDILAPSATSRCDSKSRSASGSLAAWKVKMAGRCGGLALDPLYDSALAHQPLQRISSVVSCFPALCARLLPFRACVMARGDRRGEVSGQTVSEMLTYHPLPLAVLYSNGCSYRLVHWKCFALHGVLLQDLRTFVCFVQSEMNKYFNLTCDERKSNSETRFGRWSDGR